MNYLKYFFEDMLDSQGRISRHDFWMTILWVFIFNIVFSVAFGVVAHLIGTVVKLPWLVTFVLAFVNMAVLLSTVAMQIRRLHDTNRSTWTIFYNLIPIIGQFIVIYFYCLPGDPEPNKYGHPVNLSH